MKTIVILCLFLGMFLIMQGVFDQKLLAAQNQKQVEYKFVPRTYYEEQLDNNGIYDKVATLFNQDEPWYNKAVGSKI
jgi:hypothetical protein